MKKLELKLVYFFFIVFYFSAQNICAQSELFGDTIELQISGYKEGEVLWQLSTDKINWSNYPKETTSKLNYVIYENLYFRSLTTNCNSVYTSSIAQVKLFHVADSLYNKQLSPVFKLNDVRWCTVPVPTNYIQDQTHPSIVYIPNLWNGSNIWLATTPYPNDSFYENPCIYTGNYAENKLNISFKPIANNPIDEFKIKGEGFNSDPDLFFDGSTLYCIQKKYLEKDKKFHYILQSSTNGQNWTSGNELFDSDLTGGEIVSPAVIKFKNKYRIYGASTQARVSDGKFNNFIILESPSLEKPNFKIVDKLPFFQKGSIELWHFDVFEYKSLLYMVLCAKNTKFSNTYLSTYLAVSGDYKNFYIYPRPLFNDIYSYRPTGFFDKIGNFVLVISTMDKKHKITSINGNEIGIMSVPFYELSKILNE